MGTDLWHVTQSLRLELQSLLYNIPGKLRGNVNKVM
jgi:hypothetical protein